MIYRLQREHAARARGAGGDDAVPGAVERLAEVAPPRPGRERGACGQAPALASARFTTAPTIKPACEAGRRRGRATSRRRARARRPSPTPRPARRSGLSLRSAAVCRRASSSRQRHPPGARDRRLRGGSRSSSRRAQQVARMPTSSPPLCLGTRTMSASALSSSSCHILGRLLGRSPRPTLQAMRSEPAPAASSRPRRTTGRPAAAAAALISRSGMRSTNSSPPRRATVVDRARRGMSGAGQVRRARGRRSRARRGR